MAKKLADLTGKVFGKLTVIREADQSQPGRRLWLCQCACGKVTEQSVRPTTKGCSIWCNRVKTQTPFGRIWKQYRRDAEQRNLSWELSEDQFLILITSNCYYTGRPPEKAMYAPGRILIYNGIDRWDNGKGYTWENCVPCNHRINMMKKTLSDIDFIDLCKQVAHPRLKFAAEIREENLCLL